MLLNGLLVLIFAAMTLSTQAIDNDGSEPGEASSSAKEVSASDPGPPPADYRYIDFIVKYSPEDTHQTIIAFKDPITVHFINIDESKVSLVHTRVKANRRPGRVYELASPQPGDWYAADRGWWARLPPERYQDFDVNKGFWSLLKIKSVTLESGGQEGIIRVEYQDGDSRPVDVTPERYNHPPNTRHEFLTRHDRI